MTKMRGGITPHESKTTHLSSQTECRSSANNGRTKRNTPAVLLKILLSSIQRKKPQVLINLFSTPR